MIYYIKITGSRLLDDGTTDKWEEHYQTSSIENINKWLTEREQIDHGDPYYVYMSDDSRLLCLRLDVFPSMRSLMVWNNDAKVDIKNIFVGYKK